MGSCLSNSTQGSEGHERCVQCGRKAVNNLIIVNHLCEICINYNNRQLQLTARSSNNSSSTIQPCFGEYRCTCGRFWCSRLSWPKCYQICKRCGRKVYSHAQRELRPSDMNMTNDKKNVQEHDTKKCQMCQQLGFYCGRAAKVSNTYNMKSRV